MRSMASGSSPTSSSGSTLSSMSRSADCTPSMLVPVSFMFWRTVRSGIRAGSWNTDASPATRAPAGEPTASGLPASSIVPASAPITPVRIFTSVLLPAPFAPSSAWISPASTVRSAERSAITEP